MIINPDGAFFVEEGERFPFICPVCLRPIEWDEKIVMVQCTQCTHFGFREEFEQEDFKPL